jgi:hypothetical protein
MSGGNGRRHQKRFPLLFEIEILGRQRNLKCGLTEQSAKARGDISQIGLPAVIDNQT